MSGYPEPGGYYSPNRSIITPPSLTTRQTPPLRFEVDSNEFRLILMHPPWIETGNTGRFTCYFSHNVDGAIAFTNPPNNTQFTAPALSILDGNGIIVSSNFITINPPQTDPGMLGNFFSQVQIGANLPPGYYETKWTAQYQPQPVNGISQPLLNIQAVRGFNVMLTRAPSQYFLVSTKRI